MKKSLLIVPGILVVILLVFSGCNKKTTPDPCENKGQICITNKLDSTATIQVVQTNLVFDLDKDYMQCLVLTGDSPYNFKITSNKFHLDTTFILLSCDDKQLILE